MRDISCDVIARSVAQLCVEANRHLPARVRTLLEKAREAEPFAPALDTLSLICQNADIAAAQSLPICQDTGMAVVYAEVGQEVHIAGGLLEDAVNEGVRCGYTDGYLRKSVVGDLSLIHISEPRD